MKKRTIAIIASAIVATIGCVGILVATTRNNVASAHSYSSSWSSNSGYHWHDCVAGASGYRSGGHHAESGHGHSQNCNSLANYAPHDFSNGNCICGKAAPANN